jgi:short-subunit dehydrogenase
MERNTDPSLPRPFAVITGASSGIGYQLARVFAQNGFDLLIASAGEGLLDAAEQLRTLGAEVESVRVDLATAEGVDILYERIASMPRNVDAIAMNAGVGVDGEFVNTDLEAELNLIQLNIVSLVRLTKKVLPDFVARGSGRILYTSSIAAEMPGPYYAVYAASKAFVQSFAEAIRAEVKESGVVVTALQPGATDTNFFARAGMLDTAAGAGKKDDPAEVAKQGFDALMAGKDHIVAGSLKNNLQVGAARMMPETAQAQLHAKQTKPGSAKR